MAGLLRGYRKEEGKPFTKEAAMAKYYASAVAQKASGSAIEWAGGVGFTRETGIEKFWRDSKIVSRGPLRFGGGSLITFVGNSGRYLRGHIEYPTQYDCQVHPEGV